MLLKLDDLRHWTGYDQPARIERWLTERGVKYWRGRDGQPVTTNRRS